MKSKSIWQDLPQPFVGMAPMDGVTDFPFREILAKFGKPDLMVTEFVNVEGLCHNAEQLLRALLISDQQRPILAQLYGKTPESFRQAAVLVCELGFDGIDLNMGCPSNSVAGGGSGAGLIQTPVLALQIIKATRQGVADWANGASCQDCSDFSVEFCQKVNQLNQNSISTKKKSSNRIPLPVSVKTRVGVTQPQLDDWLALLLEAEPAALTIHGRTLKQMYKGKADWQVIAQVAELVKKINSSTLIIGNGDLQSRAQGEQLAKKHTLAGVLIGRAAQGNPFVFSQEAPPPNSAPPQLAQIALEHAWLYEKTFSTREKYSFLPMRKHLAWYIKGVVGAKQIRQELVQTNNSQQVQQIFKKFQLLS